MMHKSYDGDGILNRGYTVSVDSTNWLSHYFKFFNRMIKGSPNKWRRQMLAESNSKYPVMCTLLLYNISVAQSSIRSKVDHVEAYVTSLNVAYSHDLILENEDNDEFDLASDIATKIICFFKYDWGFRSK